MYFILLYVRCADGVKKYEWSIGLLDPFTVIHNNMIVANIYVD